METNPRPCTCWVSTLLLSYILSSIMVQVCKGAFKLFGIFSPLVEKFFSKTVVTNLKPSLWAKKDKKLPVCCYVFYNLIFEKQKQGVCRKLCPVPAWST